MIYWDTSCVVKLYTHESDSGLWEKLAISAEDGLVASALLRVELAYAFEQKEARGDLSPAASQALLALFDHDVAKGRIQLIPIGSDVLQAACRIAVACYHDEDSVPLRTLDGIHLATATLLKCRRIATADVRMKAASAILGLCLV